MKADDKAKDEKEATPKPNTVGAKRGRPTNQSQADSKSAQSDPTKQVKADAQKIMDLGNSTQAGLKQADDGHVKIDEKVDDLHTLYIKYEAALREAKRIKKAYNKQRNSMKFLKTPIVSDSEN